MSNNPNDTTESITPADEKLEPVPGRELPEIVEGDLDDVAGGTVKITGDGSVGVHIGE